MVAECVFVKSNNLHYTSNKRKFVRNVLFLQYDHAFYLSI